MQTLDPVANESYKGPNKPQPRAEVTNQAGICASSRLPNYRTHHGDMLSLRRLTSHGSSGRSAEARFKSAK